MDERRETIQKNTANLGERSFTSSESCFIGCGFGNDGLENEEHRLSYFSPRTEQLVGAVAGMKVRIVQN